MTELQEQKFHDFIHAHKDEMYAELMEIVRVPSVDGTPEPGAPFGRECRRALEVVQEIYTRHGFEPKIYEDKYLLVTAGKIDAERKVSVFAHSDVVPVDDKWITTKPFEPIIKDGFIFGRGVNDNKCAIIYSLYLAIAMREGILPFDKRFEIFIGSNEECEMEDIKAYLETHGVPEMGLIIDSGFPGAYAEKTILCLNAHSPKLTEIVDAHGGFAYNVVLGEVTVRVRGDEKYDELCKAANERISVKLDGGDVVLTATGMSKHVMDPDGSQNAMHLASNVLAECGIETEAMTLCVSILDDFHGEVMGIAEGSGEERLTIANGIVRMEDGRLNLSLDTRFCANTDWQTVESKLRAWFEARGWELTRKSASPGYRMPDDDPKVAIVEEEYARMTGEHLKLFHMSGGTYGRYLDGHAVPVGLDLKGKWCTDLPKGHGSAHQPDEWISCDGFLNAIELHGRTLARFSEI